MGLELWSDLQRSFPFVPSRMEDLMCWEMDYKLFDELKKAQEARIKQEQRGEVITKLLNEANKQSGSRSPIKVPLPDLPPPPARGRTRTLRGITSRRHPPVLQADRQH